MISSGVEFQINTESHLLEFLKPHPLTDWIPVKRENYTQFHIQETPLQIQTNNTPGHKSLFDFVRLNHGHGSRDIIVEIKIENTTLSHFTMFEDKCLWEFSVQFNKPRNTAVWTIYKSEMRFVVKNEEKRWEFRFNESLVADCRNWGVNYDRILFRIKDTATIAYQGLTIQSGK